MDLKPFHSDAATVSEISLAEAMVSPMPTLRSPPWWQRGAVLDRIEQVVIGVLWLGMVWRFSHASNIYTMLVLMSETAVVVFMLIRRPTQTISLRFGDWLLAITATTLPLCVIPGPAPWPLLAPVAVVVAIAGNVLQLAAKLTLRRSFGIAPANRGVKVNGPYRFMRHPMYAGYLLIHIGMMMLIASPVNAMIYAVGWTAQIRRLLAEERLLSRDATYRAYQAKVRWRLIPGVF